MNHSLITGLFVLLGSTPLLAQGSASGINTSGFSTTGGIGSSGFGGSPSAFSNAADDFDSAAMPESSQRAGTFIGSNTGALQGAFIGAGLQQGFTGAQNFGAQGQNRGAFGNAGGFGARGQQGRGQQGRGQQGRGASTRVVRTKISVGFNYQAIQTSVVKTHLDAQFAKLATNGRFSGRNILAIPQGRTMVLRGRVSSARDRDLAERIARFEPGVSAVINELVVMDAPR